MEWSTIWSNIYTWLNISIPYGDNYSFSLWGMMVCLFCAMCAGGIIKMLKEL